MKKERIAYLIVIALLIAMLAAALTALTVNASAQKLNKFDVNEDGQADISDVTSLLDYLAGGCRHQPALTGDLTPTCASTGYMSHRVCALCGEALEDYTVLEKTAHTFGGWTLTSDPTCTEDGTETRVCANCGAVETRPIAHSGHSFENGRCKKCGALDVSAFTVGATVTFGSYEQDNKADNGKEKIEWTVLSVTDGKALLLSNYALDNQPYNDTMTSVTWETCTLRSWLNDEFLNAAFSVCEQKLIAQTALTNTHWGLGGGDTTDRVFLLGYGDIVNAAYGFSTSIGDDDAARQCAPTEYARGCKASNGYCRWWVRCPGIREDLAVCVDEYGKVVEEGFVVTYSFAGVRPALWLDLTEECVHDFDFWTVTTAPKCTVEGVETHVCKICGEAFTFPVAPTGHHFEDGACTECDFVDMTPFYQKGAAVKFGVYEQDNNTSNGKEDIEWVVLDVKDGKALLLSKYGLDAQEYNNTRDDVTWETCSLRAWLNNDFLNAAFSDSEKDLIEITVLDNHNNDVYNTYGGNTTFDRVFLLGMLEVINTEYGFENRPNCADGLRECRATEYAKQKIGTNDRCAWWLRSPGEDPGHAAVLDYDGIVDSSGNAVYSAENAVRPAVWISIPSEMYRHHFGDWTVVTAPTCLESGVQKRVCKSCGAEETRLIASTGHDYVDGVCTRCGAQEAAPTVSADAERRRRHQ